MTTPGGAPLGPWPLGPVSSVMLLGMTDTGPSWVKQLRGKFLDRICQEHIEPHLIVAYNAQLNAYRRVREHALNVAEALAGEK